MISDPEMDARESDAMKSLKDDEKHPEQRVKWLLRRLVTESDVIDVN